MREANHSLACDEDAPVFRRCEIEMPSDTPLLAIGMFGTFHHGALHRLWLAMGLDRGGKPRQGPVRQPVVAVQPDGVASLRKGQAPVARRRRRAAFRADNDPKPRIRRCHGAALRLRRVGRFLDGEDALPVGERLSAYGRDHVIHIPRHLAARHDDRKERMRL